MTPPPPPPPSVENDSGGTLENNICVENNSGRTLENKQLVLYDLAYTRSLHTHKKKLLIKCSKLVAINCKRGNTCKKNCWKTICCDVFKMLLKYVKYSKN